jgi:Cys-tRNA(Pro)/Cys-tRNA(Cys) deacylase
MTPAIECLRKAGVAFTVREFEHAPGEDGFAKEAAHKMGLPEERVFKTLIVALTGAPQPLGVAVVPASRLLDLKAVADALGARKAAMAEVAAAERATGYVHGGISPFAQKKRLPAAVDASAMTHPTVVVSAGRRGLQVELAPADLVRLTNAKLAPIAR